MSESDKLRIYGPANPKIEQVCADAKLAACEAAVEHLQAEIQSLKQELAEREWVSVENLPASGRRVIFSWLSSNGRRRTSTGFYAKKHDIEANHWDDSELADYVEENDTYYCPEGWHEECHESEIFYPVTDNVTHWQPLPPSPDITKGE